MLPIAVQTGQLDVKNIIAATWSPRGTYLQTFERPNKELGNAHKNLKVRSPRKAAYSHLGHPPLLKRGVLHAGALCRRCGRLRRRHAHSTQLFLERRQHLPTFGVLCAVHFYTV